MAVGFDKFDEGKERERLSKMSDEQLIREGRAARYMCVPSTNFGQAATRSLRDCSMTCERGVASASSETINAVICA